MVIFDCNGVLVDSEPVAAEVLASELAKAGFAITADMIAHYFTGRRPADVFAAIETAAQRPLPAGFAATVADETLKRLRGELRATPHAEHALTWLRGPKCVASSSSMDRVEVSLDCTGLSRFFGPNLFSACDVPNGKPAPDLFLHAATQAGVQPADCIVVEDAPAGVAAARAAGMTPIGFVGGRHAGPDLAAQLSAAGARIVIPDLRALKATVVELRGW